MLTVTDALSQTLDALGAKLHACNADAGRYVIQPGETATWDEPCKGGVAYVMLSGIQSLPSTTGLGGRVCRSRFAASVTAGVVRCIPTLTDAGKAPAANAVTAAGNAVALDAEILMAVALELTDGQNVEYEPVGPSGGMAGGQITFTVPVVPCAPCLDAGD